MSVVLIYAICNIGDMSIKVLKLNYSRNLILVYVYVYMDTLSRIYAIGRLRIVDTY